MIITCHTHKVKLCNILANMSMLGDAIDFLTNFV